MTIYLVTGKGVMHKAIQTDAGLLTPEADNLDQVKGKALFTEFTVAKQAAKRLCRRCYPEGGEQ